MIAEALMSVVVELSSMETVSLSRSFEGDIDTVREAMLDLGPFMEAAGFDGVDVDDDAMHIENNVGLLTIELDLRCIETDSVLAYEQVDGIFETMTTRYTLEPGDGTVTVTATTDFALDVDLVGPILDGTVISRQRKKELTAQFDYLERVASEALAAE
jgi:hypothetical protein